MFSVRAVVTLSVGLFFTHISQKAFACYTTLLLCKYFFSTILHYTTSVQLQEFTPNNLMLIILIMFCTDVLRAWAECSLKDFSQAWGVERGFRYSGREMALIHHTELGRLVVRVSSLGGCMEKCTQGTQSDRYM